MAPHKSHPHLSEQAIESSNSPKEIVFGDEQKKAKLKKHKKMKREKVLILNDETIDSREIDDDVSLVEQSVSKPKRNALKIDSSILENFTLDTPSEVLDKGETADAYTIDLKQMREKLAKPKASKKKTKSGVEVDPNSSVKTKSKKPKKKKAIILD